MSKFLIGPAYFFTGQPNFKVHKLEYVTFLMEPTTFSTVKEIETSKKLIYYKLLTPAEYVKYLNDNNLYQHIGIFLIPEVCDAIKFKTSNLKKLETLVENYAEA